MAPQEQAEFGHRAGRDRQPRSASQADESSRAVARSLGFDQSAGALPAAERPDATKQEILLAGERRERAHLFEIGIVANQGQGLALDGSTGETERVGIPGLAGYDVL